MRSSRLRLIWSSALVAVTLAVVPAVPAAATAGTIEPSDFGLEGPGPVARGCDQQPGPVGQTISWAHCQTVSVMDAARGWACGSVGVAC